MPFGLHLAGASNEAVGPKVQDMFHKCHCDSLRWSQTKVLHLAVSRDRCAATGVAWAKPRRTRPAFCQLPELYQLLGSVVLACRYGSGQPD